MVYLPTFGRFLGQMLVNIPAPWSIWDTNQYSWISYSYPFTLRLFGTPSAPICSLSHLLFIQVFLTCPTIESHGFEQCDIQLKHRDYNILNIHYIYVNSIHYIYVYIYAYIYIYVYIYNFNIICGLSATHFDSQTSFFFVWLSPIMKPGVSICCQW